MALAYLAFETLFSKLTKTKPITIAEINAFLGSSLNDYPENAPLFVTWNKIEDLRGCIGTFSALPIEEGVAKYALVSALDDERFKPIAEAELPQLLVSITILNNFVAINDPLDWTIGDHGLKVLFRTETGTYLGTFLPLVAEEQEWDKEETLWNLLRKSGYKGPPHERTVDFYNELLENKAMKLVRYDGHKVGATFGDYSQFKKKFHAKN